MYFYVQRHKAGCGGQIGQKIRVLARAPARQKNYRDREKCSSAGTKYWALYELLYYMWVICNGISIYILANTFRRKIVVTGIFQEKKRGGDMERAQLLLMI